MKNIKPKDLDKPDLEKCIHAPSPLINGKIISLADSRNHSILNSPDLRRTSILSNKSKFADSTSPKFNFSLSGVQNDTSPSSTVDESDDIDAVSEENNTILESIDKYNAGFTLISHIKDYTNSSTNSSKHSTPLISLRSNPQESSRKAMNVQEHLLGYLRGPNTNMHAPVSLQQQKKTDQVKGTLRLFN